MSIQTPDNHLFLYCIHSHTKPEQCTHVEQSILLYISIWIGKKNENTFHLLRFLLQIHIRKRMFRQHFFLWQKKMNTYNGMAFQNGKKKYTFYKTIASVKKNKKFLLLSELMLFFFFKKHTSIQFRHFILSFVNRSNWAVFHEVSTIHSRYWTGESVKCIFFFSVVNTTRENVDAVYIIKKKSKQKNIPEKRSIEMV